MNKQRIQLRNVSNVAASKTALIELPIGPRYHQVILQHGYAANTNTIAAAVNNVSEIRVKVNGRVQRVFSGLQLRDLNLLNGTAYDAVSTEVPNTAPGISLPIFFAEPWRQNPADQDALAWPTTQWDSFQIEVDLSTCTTPTLVASAVVDDFVPQGNKPVGIVKWLRQSAASAGTSQDVSTIDRRDFLQQISIYQPAGGAMTEVDLRLDGRIIHEFSASANLALLQQNGMTPAASGRSSGIYDVVLDHDGLLGSAVNLNGSRDLVMTVKGANVASSLTFFVQRLGPIE